MKLSIKSRIKSNPYLLFTILYMLLYIPVVQVYFWRLDVSYIWGYDGLRQHYPYFVYIGQIIRDFIRTGSLQNFDMSMGMGSDVFINTSGGMILDPFNWISALVPLKYSEFAYNFIIYLKIYLSGISFIFLCKDKEIKNISSVFGGLIYVFSGSMFIGFKQSFFLIPFFMFPLLISGFNRIWNGKKATLYFLALSIFSTLSFYFTYMAGLMLLSVFVIRLVLMKGNFFKYLRLFIVPTILSLLVGIGINLPLIINLYATDRLSVERSYGLFYKLRECAMMIIYYFGVYDTEMDAIIGISSFSLIALVVLWCKKKANTELKILWLLGTISLFIPFVGSLFNGFNYPCDRFIFGYALLLSFIVATVLDDIRNIEGKTNIILIVVSGIICVLNLVLGLSLGEEVFFAPILSIFLCVLIFEFERRYLKGNKTNLVYFIMIVISLCLGSLQFFSYYADEEMKNGNMIQIVNSYKEEETDKNYRTDDLKFMYFESNMAMLNKKNSYDFYSSYYNNDINKYMVDLGILGTHYSSQYSSLHGRAYLEILNGTKYLNVSDSYNNYLPYGYDGDFDSSLVYFSNKNYSASKFNELDSFQKEEMLINGIVTDEGEDDFSPKITPIPYEIVPREGITIDGNKVTISEDSASLVLRTEGMDKGEVSILIENLSGTGGNIIGGLTDGQIQITSDYFTYLNKDEVTFTGDRSWIINTGYGDCSTNQIYVNFPKGTHSFDSIKIYYRSEQQLKNTLDNFYEIAQIENINYELSKDRIDIKVNSDKDQKIVFAIPYSKGWNLYIDGNKANLYKANICFMAADISSGEHKVELKYETPYQKAGILLSVVSLALGIVYLNIGKRRI